MRKRWWFLAGVTGIGSVALALTVAAVGEAGSTAAAGKRTIYMSAVEWKGSATVAKEPYPGTASLPQGGGYESFAPGSEELKGDKTQWAIETYRFDTATVVAYEGEQVTLKIFGVNAAEHPITMPDYKLSFVVKRGVLSTVNFRAKKAGIYPIICVLHQPSHRADLVVLPRST